jgi:hypothetical protein
VGGMAAFAPVFRLWVQSIDIPLYFMNPTALCGIIIWPSTQLQINKPMLLH